jgi:hypothetical protein
MDGRTDGPMDVVSYRGATSRLKTMMQNFLICKSNIETSNKSKYIQDILFKYINICSFISFYFVV